MKKELMKILLIFFVTVFAVIFGLNYIFFSGQSPKSKAADTNPPITFTFNPSSINQSTGDFTTTIQVKPSVDMMIRGYQFGISFDKTKIQFKDIQYKAGSVSSGLGDDSSKVSIINQNGAIKVVGEIQSATGLNIPAASNTDIVTVTFTALSSSASSITAGADAKFMKINSDYTLTEVPSSGQASFAVNGGGSTTPGASNNNLNLKLKFQGISGKPVDSENSMTVKVGVGGCGMATPTYTTGTFTADSSGVWSGSVGFNLSACSSNNYIIYVKGPQHIQKKICDAAPTENTSGTYSCSSGKISIAAGQNSFDFTKILLLSGDLDQNGTVDSTDISMVRNNLGKTDTDNLKKEDVNRDGKIDTQDYSLVISALSVKVDEM